MVKSNEIEFKEITSRELDELLGRGLDRIKNYIFKEEIVIDFLPLNSISFFECKFSTLTIYNEFKRISFVNCEFSKILINDELEELSFHRICSKDAEIYINSPKINRLIISGCHDISLISVGQIKDVSIKNLTCFNSKITTFEICGTCDTLFFNKENHIENLIFDGKFQNVNITNLYSSDKPLNPSVFRNISYSNAFVGSQFKIYNSQIFSLSITGKNCNSDIELSEISCNELIFTNGFGDTGKVKIKSCNSVSKIYFLSSTLSSLEIFNSNFSNTRFITGQSIIERIRWQLVEWSEKLGNYSDLKLNNYYRGETLRNLKLNALTQQDTISYIKFYSLEMQAYQQQIKTKSWYSEDRILLCLNRISNKHGLSWRRGVLFSVAVGALFFFPNLFLLENSYWTFGWDSWSDFWTVSSTTLKLFSQSLYAAHSFDYLNEYKPNGIAFFIDIVGRIFLAYGYYQTIVAFRKFSRK